MKFNEGDYRPLPKSVRIDKSNIEGLGIFANEHIPHYTIIGISHVKELIHLNESFQFPDGLIRTPLGGFLNHSDKPNCILFEHSNRLKLISFMDIEVNEELTVDYKDYTCGESYSA